MLAILVVSCFALTACHSCEVSEWTVTKQVTCNENGERQGTCECGKVLTEVVLSTGHNFTEGYCSLCGDVQSVGIKYGLSEDGTCYSVYSVGKCEDASIIIASQYNGLPVTAIDSGAFSGCKTLTSITIPSTITTIGNRAFASCSNLSNITLPSSITKIWDFAFSDCTSLQSIIIPSSLTTLESSLFSKCTSLTTVTLPESITTLKMGVFSGCSALEEITIPSGVTKMDYGVFNNCTNLKKVTLPSAFSYFTKLFAPDSISLKDPKYVPATLTTVVVDGGESLGASLFAGCENLQSITIKSALKGINYQTFANCTSLSNLVFEDTSNFDKIEHSAFLNCTSLTSFVVPKGVTYLGQNAFYGCTNLQSVTFEEGSKLESIETGAFASCGKLVSIDIPEGTKHIGMQAFLLCESLYSISLPSTLMSIGSYAFSSCKSLLSIAIPENEYLDEIENNTFANCTALVIIEIPTTVKVFHQDVFKNCSGFAIYYKGTEAQWKKVEIASSNAELKNATVNFPQSNG